MSTVQGQSKRVPNPLSAGKIRNYACPCGSGKKAKKCHGFNASISPMEYTEIVGMINDFNIKFQTEYAEAALKVRDGQKKAEQDFNSTSKGKKA